MRRNQLRSAANVPEADFRPEPERGDPVRPFMTLIISTLINLSPNHFMRLPTLVPQPVTIWFPLVSRISSAIVSEYVAVATDLDRPREPLCRYPGSGGTKNEGLGHRAISVAIRVLPDTQTGSA